MKKENEKKEKKGPEALDLIKNLLQFNPKKRLTAEVIFCVFFPEKSIFTVVSSLLAGSVKAPVFGPVSQ